MSHKMNLGCVITRYNAVVERMKGSDCLDIVICAADAVDASKAPEEIKIIPLGYVKSQKGNFVVDDESVELITKAFKDRKLDLVIDYEHQTLMNCEAPAGGWIKDIRKGEDALIAKVEWTEKGKKYLENKEYKYLSPVVMVRREDKKAIAIQSVALTNTPAVDGMFPIVNSMGFDVLETELNSEEKKGEIKMELKRLIELLGLPEGATEADVEKAIEGIAAKSENKDEPNRTSEDSEVPSGSEVVANSTILGLLELNEKAKTEDVLTKIMALKQGGSAMSEVLVLKAKMQEKEVSGEVESALQSGKIAPNQKEWATAYALKDLDGFKNFVKAAPQVVPYGKIQYAEEKQGAIANVDVKVLKNMGMSEDEIKKYTEGGNE